MKAAAQVGLFVVVAIVLFVGALVAVGKNLYPAQADSYTVVMPDAGGLAKGARVLMAGVQVGEVTDVTVASPTQARLKIGVKKGTRLPLSTRAQIAATLVGLGDTPLSLVQDAGYRGPSGEFSPGMTIIGGKAGPLDAILPDGGTRLYGEFTETLKSVRALLSDKGYQKDVRSLLATTDKTLQTSQQTLSAFAKLADRSDALLAQNQGQINGILRTTEGTLSSVQETARSIERYAKTGKLQGGADRLIADAHRIAVQSEAILVDLRRTLNDPAVNSDLRATVANLKATTDKLPALVDDANRAVDGFTALAEKSQGLPDKLGNALDGAADLEKRLGGLTDKVGGVFGGKPRSFPPISTELDLIRESDPNRLRTDLRVSVPLSDGFVQAGLWDAFERNRVILQLGKTVNSSLDYRYGIYAAKPGVGVDYRIAPKLGFRGDLWDLNNPRLDARLRYEFGGGLIGWLGMDRIFQDPAFTIGVGIRR